MTDLNWLVSVPEGVLLTQALGINNAGQVIAIAQVIPEPNSYAMLMAGVGLIGWMARRKRRPI
ncbi:PEP-CTERM sorting domain-containing protein [Nitrosospira sp. Is2]|uniref:PEP-CTERM sorting domain-containing protein n=1 Tax=Nitrosospira sp. Is2 TaxID=3080532 RepID=UPI002955266E|nr:PEP-CTERM sorting domain-containing protein [Nitrosospira sp. Is2]WON73956.1 PEP-CTERM sorting domain-containing protein [Nitrosospira sp. Is2]